ncbi:hypothetical protein GCM10023318_01120 [Nocardia callitridis]|uniref:Transposase n=1 Tax=Nocardia callitridis TaxID=648753 RepID=A0ABP9JT19_9NOCA
MSRGATSESGRIQKTPSTPAATRPPTDPVRGTIVELCQTLPDRDRIAHRVATTKGDNGT